MKKNLKNVTKFAATGLACTVLVGAMSCNANTIVESNDVAGLTCALNWCGHENVKNIVKKNVRNCQDIQKYKLGWRVLPGQSYEISTESHCNTSVSVSTGIDVEILSAEIGVSVETGYSKTKTISGTNNTKRTMSLYQYDYYKGKRAELTYDKKTQQGDLFSECQYKRYTNQTNTLMTFDESEIRLVK